MSRNNNRGRGEALITVVQEIDRRGEVRDYADLARLGYVTRARITQIMNLLNLAPDIQEAILFLPRTVKGRDPIREKDIRPIAAVLDWRKQRKIWKLFQRDKNHSRAIAKPKDSHF